MPKFQPQKSQFLQNNKCQNRKGSDKKVRAKKIQIRIRSEVSRSIQSEICHNMNYFDEEGKQRELSRHELTQVKIKKEFSGSAKKNNKFQFYP